MLIRNLASDEAGTWRVVFDPDEREIRVEFTTPSRQPSRLDEFSFCDFLEASRPRDALHQQALDRLIDMMSKMLDE